MQSKTKVIKKCQQIWLKLRHQKPNAIYPKFVQWATRKEQEEKEDQKKIFFLRR